MKVYEIIDMQAVSYVFIGVFQFWYTILLAFTPKISDPKVYHHSVTRQNSSWLNLEKFS